MEPLNQGAITSPDPISNTSPVAPATVPYTDTVSDNDFVVAEKSIAALLRKRDGTEMSEAEVAARTLTRNDLGTHAMNGDADVDETQAVMDTEGQKRNRR